MNSETASQGSASLRLEALTYCPWKDTDHRVNPEAYCSWCEGFESAVDALRLLPVARRMAVMGMEPVGLVHQTCPIECVHYGEVTQ